LAETFGEAGLPVAAAGMVGVPRRVVEASDGCEPLLMLRYPFGGGGRDMVAVTRCTYEGIARVARSLDGRNVCLQEETGMAQRRRGWFN